VRNEAETAKQHVKRLRGVADANEEEASQKTVKLGDSKRQLEEVKQEAAALSDRVADLQSVLKDTQDKEKTYLEQLTTCKQELAQVSSSKCLKCLPLCAPTCAMGHINAADADEAVAYM
jgi:chromosome segregation ATPase